MGPFRKEAVEKHLAGETAEELETVEPRWGVVVTTVLAVTLFVGAIAALSPGGEKAHADVVKKTAMEVTGEPR